MHHDSSTVDPAVDRDGPGAGNCKRPPENGQSRRSFYELLANNKVPGSSVDDSRIRTISAWKRASLLPGLRDLNGGVFDSLDKVGGGSADAAIAESQLALAYLADKVGGQALLNVEKRTAGGEDFESALNAETGHNFDTLNAMYTAKIPIWKGK